MLETPRIVETAERLTAVIRLTVPSSEVRNVMGPGIKEVMDVIAAQGIAPAGPWLTHHLRRPGETFDFEICVPVSEPVKPEGRVRPGRWPAMKVARAVYRGPYEGLGAAWGEFGGWIAANGHSPADDLWEQYVIGPESGPDASGYRTELNRPLLG